MNKPGPFAVGVELEGITYFPTDEQKRRAAALFAGMPALRSTAARRRAEKRAWKQALKAYHTIDYDNAIMAYNAQAKAHGYSPIDGARIISNAYGTGVELEYGPVPEDENTHFSFIARGEGEGWEWDAFESLYRKFEKN